MTKSDVKARIAFLSDEIRKHNHNYYVANEPQITDYEFDKLYNELVELEKAHPEYIDSNSPTQTVNGDIDTRFQKVRHTPKMLSLRNAYSKSHLEDWLLKVWPYVKEHRTAGIAITAEPKYDGISIEMKFIDGKFVQASTRGDGEWGEDVTHTVKKYVFNNKPPILPYTELIVRGEIVMSFAEFERINVENAKKGILAYASPRNLASGTIRRLEVLDDDRRLTFIPFEIISCKSSDPEFNNATLGQLMVHGGLFSYYSSLNYVVNNAPPSTIDNVCVDIRKDLFKLLDEKNHGMHMLYTIAKVYPTDGLVFKINNKAVRDALGSTSHHPHWAVAYKFPEETVTVEVEDVIFQVGRTGTITPVILVAPAKMSDGSTIRRATLHNVDILETLSIRKGDLVAVKRAGAVIPQIASVVQRSGTGEIFKYPDRCPDCASSLIREGSVTSCTNYTCPGRIITAAMHFFSKDGVYVEGLGVFTLMKIHKEIGFNHPLDLMYLDLPTLVDKVGMSAVMAEKIMNRIEQIKKTTPIAKLIYALGIKGVGKSTAHHIAKYGKTLKGVRDLCTSDAVLTIPGIGRETASNLQAWWEQYNEFIFSLLDDVEFFPIEFQVENVLKGKKICFTGNNGPSRTELTEKIVSMGGEYTNSVKNAAVLIAPKGHVSAKTEEANKNGVPIITWDEFLNGGFGTY